MTLEDALVAAAARRRNASLPRHVAVAANDVAMTEGEAAAVARIGANERGFVDVLVAFLAAHKSHAIEQASRRWRGGRRDDSAQRAVASRRRPGAMKF